MDEIAFTKAKFILRMVGLIGLIFILFCGFIWMDKFHERCVKVKLAELGFDTYYEQTKETK